MKFSIMCLCASMAFSGAAMADTADELVTADLYYSKAKLATVDGAKETYVSLKRQAREVCTIEGSYGDRLDRSCVADLVLDAVEQIDSPLLTAIHEGTKLPFRLASK